MNLKDILQLIITPTLDLVGLGGKDADMLMLCTGAQETKFEAFKQHPGPALGWWQIEPRTHKDIRIWLTNGINRPLLEKVLSSCYMQILPPNDDALIWNLRYSLIAARLVYHRAKLPLPNSVDPDGMADYYLKYYNAGGKAIKEKVLNLFRRTIDDVSK